MASLPAVLAVTVSALPACRIETHPPARGPQTVAEAAVARTDSAAVLATLEAYYRDFSARDWDAFAAHFWPGADLTTMFRPPNEAAVRVVITPVPEFVAQAPAGPGSRAIFEERMLEARITVQGDLAQAWVRYRARFGDPGDVTEWEGIDAFTLLRFEGTWRIVELAFAPDESAGP